MNNSVKQMNQTFNYLLPCISKEKNDSLGDHSSYHLFQGSLGEKYNYQNATWSFIYFNIQNIAVLVLLDETPSSHVDYKQLTYQYAKIIENRIHDNLDDLV
jgi:hypothetical protein